MFSGHNIQGVPDPTVQLKSLAVSLGQVGAQCRVQGFNGQVTEGGRGWSHTALPPSSVSGRYEQAHILPLTLSPETRNKDFGLCAGLLGHLSDCYSGMKAMWPYPFIWLLCKLIKRKQMNSGYSSSTEATPYLKRNFEVEILRIELQHNI